jgi:ABC-type lipoprotein export system ATPase subunit
MESQQTAKYKKDRKRNEWREIYGIELLTLTARKYHQTLLLITHDVLIAEMADRVITIQDGEIISDKYLKSK